ncbi:DUF397 domain-containing protein [Nocardiopsis sp. FIRDI 009]
MTTAQWHRSSYSTNGGECLEVAEGLERAGSGHTEPGAEELGVPGC